MGSVTTMMSAMSIAAAIMVMVAIGPMILSFVTINIEKPLPAQIKIVPEVASPIPTMKIVMLVQPPGIMVVGPDNVVPVVNDVTSVVTSLC